MEKKDIGFFEYYKNKLDNKAMVFRKPKYETLADHRKHCKAKPGNCPFEKMYDAADDLIITEPKKSQKENYDKLATVMTDLYNFAKNVALAVKKEHKESDVVTGEAINKAIQSIQEVLEMNKCEVKMDKDDNKFLISSPAEKIEDK